MIPLLDTVIGFAAVMLMLSLLVKSLTSLLKNQVDFYSQNLQHEVDRLVKGTLGFGWKQAVADLKATGEDTSWLEDINWERLGQEFLTKGHMEWLLGKLGASAADLVGLEGRLAVHVANLKYAFETRIKNLALAVGLALCLGLNINGLTIWQTLYSDQQLRTTFATTYAKSALASAETAPEKTEKTQEKAAQTANRAKGGGNSSEALKADPSPLPPNPNAKTDHDGASKTRNDAAQREKLDSDTQTIMKNLVAFQKNARFGIGRFWTEDLSSLRSGDLWKFSAFEFLGSLMTAVLISIGAAYWHDLLQTLTSLKK
jgi:hypothetical protein